MDLRSRRARSSDLRSPLAVLAALGLLVLACSAPPASSPGVPRFSSVSRRAPSDDLSEARVVARAQTRLALSLLDERPRDENALIGAYGLNALLTMLALAGDEATERAVYATLGLEGERRDVQQAFNTLDQTLASRGAERIENEPLPFVLRNERALFVRPDFPVRGVLLDDLARWHGAGAHEVDLSHADGVAAVNAWFDERTEGAIPSVLERPIADVRAVWVDATYFSAMWALPFSTENTADLPFRAVDGEVTVPTMRGRPGSRFSEGGGWRAAHLPYGGGDVAMWIVVPDDPTTFRLDFATLETIASRFEPVEVIVFLPRFAIDARLDDLRAALEARGLPIEGPWSRLSTEDTFVASIGQRATIRVDELGTVAAAASYLLSGGISVREVEQLVVDRPFYFVIRDLPTGATLFVGRVVDPSAR